MLIKMIAVTGANGRIGKRICSDLGERCMKITRVENEHMKACDLVRDVPELKANVQPPEWVFHFATSFGWDDKEMMKNVLRFCERYLVRNVIFLSTWSIMFPAAKHDVLYTRVKRECEELLTEAPLDYYCIIRPSVVIDNSEQQWDKILSNLSPLGPILGGMYRCFVHIDDVACTIQDVIRGDDPRNVISILGKRSSLRDSVPHSYVALPILATTIYLAGVLGWRYRKNMNYYYLVGAICVVTVVRYMIKNNSFARSFFVAEIAPRNTDDVISLSKQQNISVRGRNNKNAYFSKLSESVHKITLLSSNLNHMEINNDVVRVGSGVTFKDLLPFLRNHNKLLQNYPNYHGITIGACVATPVHGSDLKMPFIADLIMRFSYVHAGKLHQVSKEDKSHFYSTVFNLPKNAVVIDADIQITHKIAKYRPETTELKLNELVKFLVDAPSNAACEIRQNRPGGNVIATIFNTMHDCSDCQELKWDSIGSLWNHIDKFTPVARTFSHYIIEFEWFMPPNSVQPLIDEIQKTPFFKLLYRYNRNIDTYVNKNPFYGTISIAISCPVYAISLARKLYTKFKPLEHNGKHMIGTGMRPYVVRIE